MSSDNMDAPYEISEGQYQLDQGRCDSAGEPKPRKVADCGLPGCALCAAIRAAEAKKAATEKQPSDNRPLFFSRSNWGATGGPNQRRAEEALHFRQMMTDPPHIWRDKIGAAVDLRAIDDRYLDNIVAFCGRIRPEYRSLAQYGYAVAQQRLRRMRKIFFNKLRFDRETIEKLRKQVPAFPPIDRASVERAAKRKVLDELAAPLQRAQQTRTMLINACEGSGASPRAFRMGFEITKAILTDIARLREKV